MHNCEARTMTGFTRCLMIYNNLRFPYDALSSASQRICRRSSDLLNCDLFDLFRTSMSVNICFQCKWKG